MKRMLLTLSLLFCASPSVSKESQKPDQPRPCKAELIIPYDGNPLTGFELDDLIIESQQLLAEGR